MDVCRYFPMRQRVPENLTVVTFNNGVVQGYNEKPMGLFESFVDGCCVLGSEIKEWQNKMKILLLFDFLGSVETEFVLICDSSDVFVVNRLDYLVEGFQEESCGACFNAEKRNWPYDLPEEIVCFENTKHPGMYLNAGVWMAYTEFAKFVVSSCLKTDEISDQHEESEQVHYKFVYSKLWPEMKIDADCSIFQGLNRTGTEELSLVKPM